MIRGCWDKTVYYIISECSKLAQKECKNRHDWVGLVIHLELCKRLKSDHTNKWYMHKLESILDNETHKILWDVEIQTDSPISDRWSDLVFISKSFQIIVFVFIVFFHNVSAAVSSSLLQVSPVDLGIEMIQPGKSFLKFDCWKWFPRLNNFYAQNNRGYSGRNVVKKTIKTKAIDRKILMTKIIKLRLN